MYRKGQCLQQKTANELGHSPQVQPPISLLINVPGFHDFRGRKQPEFVHDQTRVSSRHVKEKTERAALDGKQRFAQPARGLLCIWTTAQWQADGFQVLQQNMLN